MQVIILVSAYLLITASGKANCITAKDIVLSSHSINEKATKEAAALLSTIQKTPKLSQGVFSNSACMISKETKMVQDESRRIPHEKRTLLTNIHQKKKVSQQYKISTDDKVLYNNTPKLLIFISFSLGHSTLIKLYKDAQRVGGRLILRGLYKDSFRLTQQKIIELKIVVDIDPTLFERFNVKEAPTFILTEPYENNQSYKFDQLSGNTSLTYALEKFVQEGEIEEAKTLLNKLQEGLNVKF